MRNMTTKCRVFRSITLGLQIIAMLAYYLPTLINGGYIAVAWMAIGVVQTVFFSVVFFRDSRTRVALAITFMVIGTALNLVMLLLIGLLYLMTMGLGLDFTIAVIYALCSLIAVIFALCFPRKYHTDPVEPIIEHVEPVVFQDDTQVIPTE